MRNVARLIAAGTTSLLLVGLAPASPAHAAATRSSEAPAAGAVISAMPGTISATFGSETISAVPAPSFSVAAPAGFSQFSCGSPVLSSVNGGTNNKLSCATSKGAAAAYADGVYTVTYSFSSVPGGVTSSTSYTFVLDTTAPTNVTISPSSFTAATPSNTPISVTGTSLAGASVSVNLSSSGGGASPTNTVVAAVDGTFSTSFPNTINDGTITATAMVTGSGGTSGPSATATMSKDVTLPTVSSTTPVEGGSERSTSLAGHSGITAIASEDLKTGVAGSTITVKDGSNTTVPVTVDFPTTSSVRATPTSVLSQGTYTATISLVDLVGNAAPPVVRHFVIDDTAPSAPSFSVPALINKANRTSYVVSGTGEPGATVDLTLSDVGSAHTAIASATVASSGVATGTWQTAGIDVSSLNDGIVQFSATQTDAADNTSDVNNGTSTSKDTVAPHVSNVHFDKTAYKAGDATATVLGSVDNSATPTPAPESGATVQVTINDSGTGHSSASTTAHADGTFSVDVPISTLADGALVASVVASDAATNASVAATGNATKDTGLPVTPTVTATHPINAANQSVVLVSGTTENSATVTVTVNDTDAATDPVVRTTTADPSTGAYSISNVNVSSLSDGTLTFSAVAQDAALNNSGAGTFTTTKDTQAPANPTAVLPPYVNAANAAAVPVSGAADSGSTVTITVTDTTSPTPLTVSKTVAASSGAYSTTVDVHTLKDGLLSFSVVSTDAAGNPSGAATPTVTKDVVAPGAPVNLSVSPSPLDYATQSQVPHPDVTVTGKAAVADQGTSGLKAVVTLVDTDPATPNVTSGPVDVDGTTGAFTAVIPNADVLTLTDSTLQVQVTITDAAGNTGSATVPTLVKDVTKLAVSSLNPADNASLQSLSSVVASLNEALVTGTSSASPPYSSISVTNGLGNPVLGSLQFSAGNKTLTFTPSSAFTEGASPYTVTLHATDVNDTNDTVQQVTHFSIDVTAPVAPTVDTVTDPVNSINETAVTVTGHATEVGVSVAVTIAGTSGTVTKSATSGAGGAFTVSGIDVTSLPDGQLTVTAKSTDAAGNVGPSSGGLLANKETVLPTVSGLAATATHFGALTTTVTGSISEAGTVAISATDGTHTVSGSATVAGDKTFSGTLDLSTFVTGNVTVHAVPTDAVGNIGPTATTTTTHDAAVPPSTPAKPVATAGDRKASVAFTAPATGGAPITSYTVVASPGGRSATGTSSPIIVTGLTNGVDYTFTVKATNRAGSSAASPASDAVMPLGVSSITLNALPSKVTYGTYLTLAGVVHRSDASVPFDTVGIFVRTDSGVVKFLAEAPVGSTGAWSYRYRPSSDLSYVAAYGDDRNDDSFSVGRRVLVAVKVTASAPTGSHTVNQVITGAVAPKKVGTVVTLYKVTSTGALVKLATAKLSSTSTYRFSVRLPAGSTKLRVVVPNTTNNVSGSVTFTAKRS